MEIINKYIAWEKTTIFLFLSIITLLTIFNPFDKTFTSRFLSLIIIGIILFLLNRFYWTAPNRPWDYAMALSILVCMFSLDSDFSVTFGLVSKFIMIDIFVRLFRNALEIQKDKHT